MSSGLSHISTAIDSPIRGCALSLAAVVGTLLCLTPGANAQYMAQRGGTALSADLSRFSSLAGNGRDFAAEARYRNSVAFGRAPGGQSFRGGLGYKDPTEFTGHLGSNSLSSFAHNSALSNISTQGLRREQTFEALSTLSTGNTRGAFLPGRGVLDYNSLGGPSNAYARGTGPTGTAALQGLGVAAVRRDARLERNASIANRLATNFGTDSSGGNARLSGLNSGSAYTSGASTGSDLSDRLGVSRRIAPTTSTVGGLEGYRADLDTGLSEDRTLANSTLSRGRAERMVRESAASRTQSEARRPGDASQGRIDTSLPRPESSRADLKLDTGANAPGGPTSYDELRKSLERYGAGISAPGDDKADPGKGAISEGQRRLNELRGELRDDGSPRERLSLLNPGKGLNASRSGKTTEKTDPNTPTKPGDATPDAPDTKATDPASLRSRFDPGTLKMIRDLSGRVESLVPADQGKRDFYADHMKAGQNLLATSMYFDAEDRFSRALQMRPGDVSAQTGRIHSQIGAGLSLSAGQNLRRMLSEYPEATGLRYAQALRPSPERTQRVIEQLRENIAGVGKLRRESALLLAYLGFQTGAIEVTREGLDAMARIALEDPAAKSGGDERLVDLLRGVWLDAKLYEAPPDAPNGAPPGAPDATK